MIYIATHKEFISPMLTGYIPLQVGAECNQELGYQKDSEGDNISYKNPNYCELTGLYWIWRNSKEPTKGLVHYRRYFGTSNLSSKYESIYSHAELESKLQQSDIVLPYVENLKQSVKEEIMISCCTEQIFNQLRKIISDENNKYLLDFDKVFASNKLTLFNMMFCKSDLFDSYCEWLFNILFKLEEQIDISNLNAYQQRLYGFLSERLLNVWVKHHNLRVFHTPVVNTEMPISEKFALLRRRITNEIIYRIIKR